MKNRPWRVRLVRRIPAALLYLGFLVASVLAILFVFFWRPFVGELRERRRPKTTELRVPRHADLELMKRIGSLQTDKDSSFVHFSQVKAEGTIRVCAYGDSFTHGSEVGPDQDYPSLLQRQFAEAGMRNVEVLNFGSGWHGFHQSYLIWMQLGSRFQCDFNLLGPSSFHADRDLGFNHTDLVLPYFLHSRFVLEDGDVRRVDVDGDDHPARFADYHRFFPRWRYLRYDRAAPPLLRSLIPSGRTLANPLYYWPGPPEEEASATHRLLLRRMAGSGVPLVLGHLKFKMIEFARTIPAPGLAVLRLRNVNFPYRAALGHFNAAGNWFVATQYFAQIVAGSSRTLTLLEPGDLESPGGPAPTRLRPALSDYDAIDVVFDGVPSGFFSVLEKNRAEREFIARTGLRDAGIRALLAIKSARTSLLDACFAPLDFDVETDATLVLRVEGQAPVRLARVGLVDERVNLGVARVEGVYCNRGKRVLFAGNRHVPAERLRPDGRRVELWLGSRRVAEGRTAGGSVKLTARVGGYRMVRGSEIHFLSPDELPETGTVSLSLLHPRDGELRVPIGRWRKRRIEMPRTSRPVATQIVKGEGGTAVLRRTRHAAPGRPSLPDLP